MGQGSREINHGPGWRQCSVCRTRKSSNDFSLGSHAVDNRQSRCKPCDRDVKMKSKFNISVEQYEKMLINQNGTCFFCPATEYRPGKRLGVDHDRSCCPGNRSCGSCIRALLCQRCNTVLGLCNDDPKLLHELAYFLERM